MFSLRNLWLSVTASMVFAGAAAAQQPVRAVYVTGQDGNPKVYYVTGTVPPEKLPTVAPAAPVIPPAPVQSAPKAIRYEGPAHLPPAATTPAAETSVVAADASCRNGHCGPRCKHGPTSFWTCLWTPATVPPPLGSAVRGAFDMQRDNALSEYFVIYREDFLAANAELNATGSRHVDGVVRRLGMLGAPVKVEPTGNAALDQKRVGSVVEKLIAAGIPAQDAANRVVIGTTRAEGLRNGDIESINRSGGLGGSGLGTGGGGGFGGTYFGGGFGGGFGYR